MTIQYVGLHAAATSRTYTFRVLEALEETREFTIEIQLGAFRSTPLRFQDGPDICFARLKQEVERETQESRLESHLRISEQDIQEYLQRRYPHKPS